MHPIDKAADIIGSQTVMAAVLGVSKGAVSQWKCEDRRVPAAHCVAIEAATNGEVTRRDLRPDDWQKIWPELTPGAPPGAKAAAHIDIPRDVFAPPATAQSQEPSLSGVDPTAQQVSKPTEEIAHE